MSTATKPQILIVSFPQRDFSVATGNIGLHAECVHGDAHTREAIFVNPRPECLQAVKRHGGKVRESLSSLKSDQLRTLEI